VRLAAALAAAGVLAVAAGAGAQSLWREGAPGASLFADHRARSVNDIVTIIIVEQSSSSRSAATDVSKDTNRAASVNQFPSIFDPVAKKLVKPLTDPLIGYESPSKAMKDRLGFDISATASHEGKGSIDRSDRVSGQIAARVVKVLDNGNLLIEGRRAVLVNDETQVITLSGTVRPQDVTGSNTVLSSQIADAEIQMTGRGLLADAQRPGILYRILDWLRLF
jgi:flagellar L-ring protein precursor FlgH